MHRLQSYPCRTSVTVTLAGGTTKASIYSALTGGTVDADGIITTGTDGTFAFYVDEDDYSHSQQFRIVWSKSGFTSETWDYIQIFPDGDRTLLTGSTVDQGDAAIVGTLAWHIADLAGSKGTVTALDGTYDMTTNTTIPATMEFKPQIGVLLDGSATLTINSSFSPGRYQVFDPTFVVEGLSWAFPEWFGAAADPSTPTDDKAAFDAGFAALTSGGSLIIDEGGQYYIATSVTMPKGTRLTTPSGVSTVQREGSEWEDFGGLIYLNAAATIQMSEGCSIVGLNLMRYGISLPMVYADIGDWTGTAIRLMEQAHFVYIGHVGIIGFAGGIDNYKGAGDVTDPLSFYYSGNPRIEYIVFDVSDVGIRIGNSLSTTWVSNCEAKPQAALGGAAADADLERPGIAYYFAGENDSVRVTDCLAFGYNVGFKVESAHDVLFKGVTADHGTAVNNASRYGFNIVSNESTHVRIEGCQVWGSITIPIRIQNSTAANQDTIIIGNSLTGTNHNIHIVDGGAQIIGNLIRGGEDAVYLDENADDVIMVGNRITNTNYVIKTHASFDMAGLVYGKNFTAAIATAITDNWVCPTVASAGTVTLPSGHNTVIISGTTGITSVTASFPGDRVSLLFEDTLTVTDGSNLKLGGNFSATADDILTLTCDGTNWYQEGNN